MSKGKSANKAIGYKNNASSREVIFQYNGHSFEAYESLGLEVGASVEEINKAFLQAPKNSSGEVDEIIKLAYFALTKSSEN